jgi:hypothetical protein
LPFFHSFEKSLGVKEQKSMQTPQQNVRKKTPPRLRPSIHHDAINPTDYMKYTLPWACEDCSHYSAGKDLCTLGFETKWHKKAEQQRSYELSGRVALCRFQEID